MSETPLPEVDRLSTGEEQFKLPITDDPLVLNPLFSIPRNWSCLCGSGRKWKRCCGPRFAARIPKSQALEIADVIKKFVESQK